MSHIRQDVRTGTAVDGRIPPGWGTDDLGSFLNLASDNVLGTYANLQGLYARLRDIDALFLLLSDHMLNPGDPMPALCFLQAHSAYRAAAGLACSCQSSPAFMVMRGCLEWSLYALLFRSDPRLAELWGDRHESDEARRAVRSAFTYAALRRELEQSAPEIATIVAGMYEKCIDFGAHPNIGALLSAARTTAGSDRTTFEVLYLSAERPVVEGTLRSTAQAGICSLLVFRSIYRERFDILGISERITRLQKGL